MRRNHLLSILLLLSSHHLRLLLSSHHLWRLLVNHWCLGTDDVALHGNVIGLADNLGLLLLDGGHLDILAALHRLLDYSIDDLRLLRDLFDLLLIERLLLLLRDRLKAHTAQANEGQ